MYALIISPMLMLRIIISIPVDATEVVWCWVGCWSSFEKLKKDPLNSM